MKYILQIGEGNFLRAFIGDYLQSAKESGSDFRAVICQPRTNTKIINALKAQNCEYDVILRGKLDGKIVDERKHINCVERAIDTVNDYSLLLDLFADENLQIVISNTTEAGIVYNEADRLENSPAVSYPAKLTALLYHRFRSSKDGLVIIPCELIENNGDELKRCILQYCRLWALPDEFSDYINNECSFCNSLVDRIVTGHNPEDSDPISVSCEPYKSFVIEADERARSIIPFEGITYTDSIDFYRKRKVRILNGIHTMTVPAAFMAGFDIVRDTVNDSLFSDFIKLGVSEIESTLEFPCSDFTESVLERFSNPFIDHRLLDIALNSISKFRVRCLPSLLDCYERDGKPPKALTFSLAALIAFYLKLSDRDYELRDDENVLEFFSQSPEAYETLKNTELWGCDLSALEETVSYHLKAIRENGIPHAIKEVVYE